MTSLNELLHDIVDSIHGRASQRADELHQKVDDAVEPPKAADTPEGE